MTKTIKYCTIVFHDKLKENYACYPNEGNIPNLRSDFFDKWFSEDRYSLIGCFSMRNEKNLNEFYKSLPRLNGRSIGEIRANLKSLERKINKN